MVSSRRGGLQQSGEQAGKNSRRSGRDNLYEKNAGTRISLVGPTSTTKYPVNGPTALTELELNAWGDLLYAVTSADYKQHSSRLSYPCSGQNRQQSSLSLGSISVLWGF